MAAALFAVAWLVLGLPFAVGAALEAKGSCARRTAWAAAGLLFGPGAVLLQYFAVTRRRPQRGRR